MPRGLRVEFAGAIYHVMARGNERKAIFRDDADRKRFLATVAEAVERFGLVVHAYCLMPNHYHLLVETPRANLSQAMGWVQTAYTVRFNHGHRGHNHGHRGQPLTIGAPVKLGVNAGESPAGAIRWFRTEDRAYCVAVRRGGEPAWSRTVRSQCE